MNTERHSRAKRGSFIINIVETGNGYSIVEGSQLLNRSEGAVTNQIQTYAPSTINTTHTSHSQTIKQSRPVYKKINLIFLRSGQKIAEDGQTTEEEKHTDTPEYCKVFAQWFDLNKLHELEEKEVLSWLCQKHSISTEQVEERQDLQSWIKLYRKHRNFVVKLYISEFAEENKYMSASYIRKYLCCDAFWLMKLHLFLSNIGVINSNNYNFNLETNNRQHIFKQRVDGKKELLKYELNMNIRRVQPDQEDENQLLKRLTASIRPHCDYCRIHCGIVWFEHHRSLDPKQIANIMKNVNSKNPPLSQKEYEYILCVRCYCQANFPLLLTHYDFKKISVNDRMEPGRKKRSKRRKRQKRRREGDQEIEDGEPRQNGQEEERSHIEEEDQNDKKEEVKAVIARLIDNQGSKNWNLQETDYLLQLVDKHEQDWNTIHEKMKKKGYCQQIQTEELILYFLSLPRRGIGKWQQQYDDDEFIEANYSGNKTNIFDRLAQKKLNDAVLFSHSASKQLLQQLKKEASKRDYLWKDRLEQIVKLEVQKYDHRLQYLEGCETLVRGLKVFNGRQ